MPYLQLDLEAKKAVPSLARAMGVDTAHAGWGLMELWDWCWSNKRAVVSATLLRGFFGAQNAAEALEAFGFVAPTPEGFRVCGADRYLRLQEGWSRGGKAASGNLKRGKSGRETSPARAGEEPETGPEMSRDTSPGFVPALTPSTEHRAPILEEEERVLPAARAAPSSSPKRRAEDLQEVWNHERAPSMPEWKGMPKQRRARAVMRLGDRPLEEWRQVVARMRASAFCRGENDRGWVASPDWLLQPDTATKVLEGKYDNRGRAKGPPGEVTREDFEEATSHLERDRNGDLVL